MPGTVQGVPIQGASAFYGGNPATVLGLRARQWMVVAIVLGCCYAMVCAVAGVAAWTTLTREPTTAELERAANAEVARRWQVWPAGRIFPERLPYTVRRDKTEYASRLGIAAEGNCQNTVDPEIASVLSRHGCRAVLRATYADQLQGIVVTVGVAAFPDAWKADRAYRELPKNPAADRSSGVRPALRAVSFPGTASARFLDAARQDRTSDRGGPYVMLTTAGHSDGRPAAAITKRLPGNPYAFAAQLADAVVRPLSARAVPDCSSREWRC
ncbi:hypothetical protein Acsp03_44340 [Actinomadura sp. NBRC 104412]|nr:hypothetical protein Acsp03_44340 [Actinomadura sp. NBRC 104412]